MRVLNTIRLGKVFFLDRKSGNAVGACLISLGLIWMLCLLLGTQFEIQKTENGKFSSRILPYYIVHITDLGQIILFKYEDRLQSTDP